MIVKQTVTDAPYREVETQEMENAWDSLWHTMHSHAWCMGIWESKNCQLCFDWQFHKMISLKTTDNQLDPPWGNSHIWAHWVIQKCTRSCSDFCQITIAASCISLHTRPVSRLFNNLQKWDLLFWNGGKEGSYLHTSLWSLWFGLFAVLSQTRTSLSCAHNAPLGKYHAWALGSTLSNASWWIWGSIKRNWKLQWDLGS
jgi:hypothetical protein